jgi:hypothetical protein
MLSFLNTAIWPFLIAIALPLLIHLLTKKKLKVVPFSSLAFLKQMQRDQIRQLKLRQLLLLLLRMAIIALLVLAFARPTLRSRGNALSRRAQATLAIAIDNSLSMAAAHDGATLLQRARRQAGSLAAILEPGDEAYLISGGSPAKVFGGPYRSAETLTQALTELPQEWSATDLAGALTLGQRLLAESKNLNKELYLVSDFRSRPLARGHAPSSDAGASMRGVAVRCVAPDNQNASLLAAGPLNQIFEIGKTIEFSATVANTGAARRDLNGQQVALFLNGKRAAQQIVEIAAGQKKSLTLRAVPSASEAGFVAGELRLDDDGLLADNSRFFAAYVPANRRVVIAAPSEEESTFLKLALDPQGSTRQITMRAIAADADALAREAFTDTDAIILVNVPRLSDGQARRIADFVKAGGGLIVFPGSAVDLRQANETLMRALELGVFGESMGSLTTDADPSSGVMKIGKVDFSHPMLAGIFEKPPEAHQIDSPAFRFAVQLRLGPASNVVAEYSNGFPLIVEKTFGRGRVVLFTTAADDAWSDFAFKGLYAPLVERAVALVASRLGELTSEAVVGAELTAGIATASTPELEVETPDGERVRMRPETSAQGYRVRFAGAWQPGIYKLWNDNQIAYLWAVNFESAEVELAALTDDEVKAAIPSISFQFAEAGADLAEFVRQARFGNELWPMALTLTLLAMLGEMLLYRQGKDETTGDQSRSKRARSFAKSA